MVFTSWRLLTEADETVISKKRSHCSEKRFDRFSRFHVHAGIALVRSPDRPLQSCEVHVHEAVVFWVVDVFVAVGWRCADDLTVLCGDETCERRLFPSFAGKRTG